MKIFKVLPSVLQIGQQVMLNPQLSQTAMCPQFTKANTRALVEQITHFCSSVSFFLASSTVICDNFFSCHKSQIWIRYKSSSKGCQYIP